MEPKYMTELIKNKAYDIGFDLVGICSPEPLDQAYELLKKRKDENKLPPFISDDIELLINPQKHLNTVKSIISLGLSYAYEQKNDSKKTKIALYARGKDYHSVFKKKMTKLISYIKKMTDTITAKSFTDTVALLEKEIARKAGLGWIGKNNLLINEKYGSFIVLGEILTNLELLPDEPVKNKCGNCNLCINSCPTGALKGAYNLDYELCISYLTQKKGLLSEKEKEMVGNNLWGCDNCQLLCPYNKNIYRNRNREFKPVLEENLIKILEFPKFPLNWEESAISWRGLETIKRNALIIMAKSGQKKYLQYLQNKFRTDSVLLKEYAEWAITELRSEKNVRDKS